MRNAICLFVLLLAGCATSAITLHPRGGGPGGTGTVDQIKHTMTVQIDGATYTGEYLGDTWAAITSGPFGAPRTTVGASNRATALLLGPAGQLRCEFALETLGGFRGNGVCVDAQSRAYDMLIK